MKERSPFLFSGLQTAKIVLATMKYIAADLKKIHKSKFCQQNVYFLWHIHLGSTSCFLTIRLVLDGFSCIFKKGASTEWPT